jgi:hypothetical protein
MERGADSRGEFDVGAPLSLLLLFFNHDQAFVDTSSIPLFL